MCRKNGRKENMQKVLVVVDMQNDFIDGALGTKEAVAIVKKPLVPQTLQENWWQ